MIRWLLIRHLRRRRAAVALRLSEVQDYVCSSMPEAERLESRLRAVDAELLLAESPRVLLSAGRADSGFCPRR